jgi:trimethylamine---corrinoid protein Co-methyltransferase
MTTSSQTYRQPTLEDLEELDRTGRRILERVGIRIKDRGYLDILSKAGADVSYSEAIVRFRADWLEEILRTAPSKFTLYSRDGKNDVHLGEEKVHFVNGGRVFRIIDPMSGEHRPTTLRDVAQSAALVQHLDHIRFYIIACQAHDVPPRHYHLNDFYQALNHTTKHVMGGCGDLEGARQAWELAGFVAGGEGKLADRPFISVITNLMSPLTLDSASLDILRFCCEHGIPVTCAPAPISGATGPASLAGTLAQMHAEALAGVALTQIFKPGAKVLYGAVPSAMDLRTMDFTLGSVETALMNACAVRLAKLCELPIYGSAGVTESKVPDVQAGIEKTLSKLMVALAGADCIHLAAGMLDSGNSIALEQFVIDDEIIGMIHRLLAGVSVNRDTLGLETIEAVGPGGNYVTEDHTIRHMMDEFFYPGLAVRASFDLWETKGRPTMLSKASARVEEILGENGGNMLGTDIAEDVKRTFPGIRDL